MDANKFVQLSVVMPKVKASQKTKLQLYQREFEGEMITTYNKRLCCRAFEKKTAVEKVFRCFSI
jgi:hypothetical protein